MLPTSIRPYCHALAVLVVLLPVSVSADESPACHHWSSSIDHEPMDGTIEAAFHPFFSIATGRDVTRCLATGANPNSRTKEGLTPLHFAAAFSNFETVIIALLDAGADLHARSESGESPLHLAAVNSTLDVTLTLLEAGANVDARGQLRTTPLHYAASINKSERIVNALIEGGADPNARTEGGETPLHLAAMVNANPPLLWRYWTVEQIRLPGMMVMRLLGITPTTMSRSKEPRRTGASTTRGGVRWTAMTSAHGPCLPGAVRWLALKRRRPQTRLTLKLEPQRQSHSRLERVGYVTVTSRQRFLITFSRTSCSTKTGSKAVRTFLFLLSTRI